MSDDAPTTGAAESFTLGAAWRRRDELRLAARRARRRQMRLEAAFLVLSFLALALAVLAAPGWLPPAARGPIETALLGLLIVASASLAFAIRAGDRDAASLLLGGAAEIESCIYVYASLLQGHEEREPWLLERVKDIRRRVFERLGHELKLRPAREESAEPAFDGDLLAEEYLELRVVSQIGRQAGQARRLEAARARLQAAIFTAVGAGLFLVATRGAATTLAAIAVAAALSLFCWSALRRTRAGAGRYREVAFALGQIRDQWLGLPPVDRTGDRFVRLVATTERVLGCLHDDAALSARRAVAELDGHREDLLERIQKIPAPAALDAALAKQTEPDRDAGRESTRDQDAESPPAAAPLAPDPVAPRHPPHAFVVMPFGRKQSPEGDWIDFDQIYRQLIRPALIAAGFEPFRADEEKVTGDILTDMFQELLLADLVIADLSIDNANVFYELGVRHAMRKRGLIHIQSGRSYMPFDIFNVRTLPYHCDASGKPDRAHLEKDLQAIVQCARETWASSKERIHSPIFNLLDGLNEPDARALQTPLASGYWRQHREWEQRMEVARRRRSVGDLLLLTEEARNPLMREEAISRAGLALRTLGLDELARRQYRQGLELNPKHRDFRREEAMHLGRLKRYDEAEVKLKGLLRDEPEDVEARFALGELYESMWIEEFQNIDDPAERLEEAYQASDWAKKAIEILVEAYRLDQNHAWSGTKAYVVSNLLQHVVRQTQGELGDAGDPEVELIERQRQALRGAVRFTLESRTRRGVAHFGSLVRLGYVAICEAEDPKRVTKAFRKALTMAGKNRFFLKFTLERLRIFDLLGFRPELTAAGIAVFQEELEALRASEARVIREVYRPPKVFLFEGLTIDREGWTGDRCRFPADMEDETRAKLKGLMDRLGADEDDLGVTASASCGGDILFIEECLERGMRVRVHLPLAKAPFIERSVGYAGGDWVQRFHYLWNHPDVTFLIQEDRVGPVPKGDEAYERSNRWALYSALGYGIDRVCLILLWDGRRAGARGGANHMLQQVRSHGAQIEVLDSSKFEYWHEKSGYVPIARR